MRRALALAVIAACTGCAEFGTQVQGLVENTKAHVKMIEGLRQFDAGDHEAATKTLSAALKMELSAKDRATTHKHLAFIHCTAGRERACRDEFRKALAADPGMKLDAAEAGHPIWGPTFKAVSGGLAYGGTTALGTALKQYEDGHYEESAKNLQEALDLGVPDKLRASAHKHLAFIHCSSSRERECRDEFRKAIAADPAFDLAPAEAGHPVWGPIFRSLKAGK
jgi:Tfp pilus assembly protein PilF